MERTKFLLDERSLPESWYNLVPDLPFGLEPPLHPATREPVGPEAFAPLFPEAIIRQEVTAEPDVPSRTRCARSTASGARRPLFRARRLEKFLDTPAHIYYKYEGVSPVGQPQAQHRRPAGVLQPRGGRQAPDHRDRRGPVGLLPRVRLRRSWASSAPSTWCASATTRSPTGA